MLTFKNDTLMPEDEARALLRSGEIIRSVWPDDHWLSVHVRRHSIHGWFVEGYEQKGAMDGAGTGQAFDLKPSLFHWPPVRWSQEDAINAALASYMSGAPF